MLWKTFIKIGLLCITIKTHDSFYLCRLPDTQSRLLGVDFQPFRDYTEESAGWKVSKMCIQ